LRHRLPRAQDMALLAALLSPFLGGCFTATALTWGPPPPDLTVIRVGATRETVERTLGEPVRQEHNVSTYEYNTRNLRTPGFVLLGLVADAITLGGMGAGPTWEAYRAQLAESSIVYGPRDTVIGVSHRQAEAQYLTWLHSGSRKENLEGLCHAANAGYAPAQAAQAMRYWYGLWGTDVDRVQAYVWLRLAAFGGQGSASEIQSGWASVMTPDQVAEANRLFMEWDPAPC